MFFYFSNVTEETPWQDTIRCFPNLRNFKFRCNCTNLIIKQIAKFCPSIEEIDVGYSAVSSEDVKYLCKNENGEALCRNLKKLCLKGTDVKEDGVKYLLQNLPSLEIIDHPSLPHAIYSMHKHQLPSLDNVRPYNITALDMNYVGCYSYYVDIIKVCLSVCPHLKSLTCNLLKYDDLKIFPELPDLERFNIENVSNSDINIDKVLKGLSEKLNSLTVTNCTVSLSDLSENCPRIKELDLNAVKFLIDDSKPMFNSLTSLTFDNCTVSGNNEGIGLLMTSSEKLESLTFKGYNVFSSEIKTQILKCCELNPIEILSFPDSPIEKDFVKELLLKCHTLSALNAHYVSDAQYYELLEFANILPNKPIINVNNFYDLFEDDYDYYRPANL